MNHELKQRLMPLIAVIGCVALLACNSNAINGSINETNITDTINEFFQDSGVFPEINSERVDQYIHAGKEYLLRMLDPELNGVHKYYYATEDRWEDRLHTIYTSSTIYTLFKLYDFTKDESLMDQALKSGEYILSMQNLEEDHRSEGAFFYSYFLETGEKEEHFVSGTTAKTIFTLLEFHRRTGDEKYLQAATKAADWLLTIIRDDGSVKSYVKQRGDGKWYSGKKESLLYNGQVLSALSRMYRVTKNEEYLEGAEAIAGRVLSFVEEQGCYIGDDYRITNDISSSWAVMSLTDFVRATGDEDALAVVSSCSRALIDRQKLEPGEQFGRWDTALSTSGNGWVIEVLIEVYGLCLAEDNFGFECDDFRQAIARGLPWLFDRTYGEGKYSIDLPNPEKAHGGLFWSRKARYVRTDAVCHGMNAYIDLMRSFTTN